MKKVWITLVTGLLFSSFTVAEVTESSGELGSCSSADLLDSSLITDVPWDAMYPIRLAGVDISPSGSGAPSEATSDAFCACSDDLGVLTPGFTSSMYEPARLIELVRTPDCMLSLNGVTTGLTDGHIRGKIGANETMEGDSKAYWNYHYYAYPLLTMLEMLDINRCSDGYSSMDLLYLSEIDPTWNSPEIAFFANPEAALFANPIAVAACMADAVATTVGKPIDNLYWCAGSWGTLYPLTGFVGGKSSIATKTSLLATRSVAALHRRLLAWKTMGDDNMCSSSLYPTIPKSQYKMNMMYPVVEKSGDGHEIGESALMWGEWRNVPSEEDAVYMLWRWNDCCSTIF